MSILLELPPELAAKAMEAASLRGMEVGEYLETVVKVALQEPVVEQRLSLTDFDELMDELAEGSEALPAPPVFDRAAIYDDHD